MLSIEDVDTYVALKDDLAYHQARVMLLIDAVSSTDGHAKKLDGLTKLAKLDFLTRYPAVASTVLDKISPTDPRLHLPVDDAPVEAPMIRYKYGPWDDRYYAIIGALVGRGLVRYAAARKGNVALAPTAAGRKLAAGLALTREWSEIADRCKAIAEGSQNLTGNALKDLIYARLPALMDRPHREVIA